MRRKRKGRGIDHVWQIVKYKDNMQIYAKCSCGFRHGCSKRGDTSKGEAFLVLEPGYLYNYCPSCGARKKYYTPEIKKIDKSWLCL